MSRRLLSLILSYLILIGFLSSCRLSPFQHSLDNQTDAISIAFGSCIYQPETKIWRAVSGKDPDLFFLLGDNIYIEESDDLEAIKIRYAKLQNIPDFKKLKSTIPTFAIWDDHDFGENNADSSSRFKPWSTEAFRANWHNPPAPPELEESTAYSFSFESVKFLMTDNRTYRTRTSLFGERQIKWLKKELANPEPQVVVIVSGEQLLSQRSKTKGLFALKHEWRSLLEAIRSSPANVIILSGDRHYAEILEMEDVIEATSSPLAAPKRRAAEAGVENFRRALYLGSDNFGLLTLNVQSKDAKVEFFDQDGELLLRYRFPILK